eukprot:1159625-Pelagomonas_calceolata.AAC.3
MDTSCLAAPGDVLRSPGDAAVAKRCHFLHQLAHPSQWFPPPARSLSGPKQNLTSQNDKTTSAFVQEC